MPRVLIVIGVLLIVVGLAWSWLPRSGLGRLPGDFFVARGNFKFYFPLATSLVLSIVITLILWLFRK